MMEPLHPTGVPEGKGPFFELPSLEERGRG